METTAIRKPVPSPREAAQWGREVRIWGEGGVGGGERREGKKMEGQQSNNKKRRCGSREPGTSTQSHGRGGEEAAACRPSIAVQQEVPQQPAAQLRPHGSNFFPFSPFFRAKRRWKAGKERSEQASRKQNRRGKKKKKSKQDAKRNKNYKNNEG